MAETYAITAHKRTVTKHSARETRQSGQVPGVVYGHGFDSVAISLGYSDILRIYRRAGTSSIIDIDIDGKSAKVLIHQLDLHPVSDEIVHVDLHALNLKEKTVVHVPFEFTGIAPAVKSLGATFMKSHESIDIRCLPTDIPHEVKIDISGLAEISDHISIKDLDLDPEKFEIMGMDEGTVICSVIGRSAVSDEDEEVVATEEEASAEATE